MSANHSTSEITAAQVRAQCDRILASKGFSGSKRQSAFLNYVVNATLEGKVDKLKEFKLGSEYYVSVVLFSGLDSCRLRKRSMALLQQIVNTQVMMEPFSLLYRSACSQTCK